jgi:hypothetical protein
MRWTVVLVAETEKGQRVEQPLLSFVRDQQVVLEHLGLTLAEGKRLLQAVQQRMVVAQVKRHGAVYRRCGHCKRKLSTKGYQRRWFRSAFGKVPIRVRRLTSCRCQGEPRRTFSSLQLSSEHGLIAPEWLYLQARLASLIPFARVAELLGDVLPANEGLNAETVRTRVGRVGHRLEDEKVRQWFAQPRHTVPDVLYRYPYYRRRHLDTTVGLDCGYVRNRHPRPERHFEVVAGRARSPGGAAHCFAFVRNRTFLCPYYVQEAVAAVGGALHHVTVLTDGDVGLRELQHEAAPHGDHVTDWFHIAMRFQVLTQTAKGVPEDDADMRGWVIETLERAKWHLWHGHRWRTGELLEDLHGWTQAKRTLTPLAISKLRRRLRDFRRFLHQNRYSLPCYAIRYRYGMPISTATTESTVNQVISRRMVKHQQMRWSRDGAQRVLDVRTQVLNGILEDTFRRWYPSFQAAGVSQRSHTPHNS